MEYNYINTTSLGEAFGNNSYAPLHLAAKGGN